MNIGNKSDGKRSVAVSEGSDGVDITTCRNGKQSVVVTVDPEMMDWLADAIDEYRENPMGKNDKLSSMTLREAMIELQCSVYDASYLVEQLEFARDDSGNRKVVGNGHHIRQQIANAASNILAKHWASEI